jgi:hypothetical protein
MVGASVKPTASRSVAGVKIPLLKETPPKHPKGYPPVVQSARTP